MPVKVEEFLAAAAVPHTHRLVQRPANDAAAVPAHRHAIYPALVPAEAEEFLAARADSRFHLDDIHKGFVPLSDVVGRAEFVVWPLNHISFLSAGHDLSRVPVNKKP